MILCKSIQIEPNMKIKYFEIYKMNVSINLDDYSYQCLYIEKSLDEIKNPHFR